MTTGIILAILLALGGLLVLVAALCNHISK